MNPRILVAGSANIDFITNVKTLPGAGETVISTENYALIPGGKGGNTAVAAARAGGKVIFCTKVGNDPYGAQLMDAYKKENITVRLGESLPNVSTGLASIIVESATGENRIVVYPGANNYLTAEDVEEGLLAYPDAMLLQLEIKPETVLGAVKLANKKNVPVILDAGPASKAFPLSRLGRLEIFSPNETEAYIYTGIHPTNLDNMLKICMELFKVINTKYIVLKLGDRGCYIYDGLRCKVVPAYDIRAVDTTAAGDTFTAALTVEYLRTGGDIIKACRYANGAGALSATRPGAYTSIPTDKEIRQFIREKESL